MMGEGFAIKPENGKIYSPVTATVVSIFKTKHAVGLKTEYGLIWTGILALVIGIGFFVWHLKTR